MNNTIFIRLNIKKFCSLNKSNAFAINSVNNFPFLNPTNLSRTHLINLIDKERKILTPKTVSNLKADFNTKPGKLGGLPINFSSEGLDIDSSNLNEAYKDHKHILIAGKSNVGKSSLINCLVGSKQVISSKTPGKTNTLTFIRNSHLRLSLIDSPGYGYANRSTSEVKAWERMMQEYISKTNNLISIILLVDSEHGITQLDEGCIKLASFKKIEIVIVFTKSDKLVSEDYKNIRLAEAKKSLVIGKTISNFVFFTSVKEQKGITELKAFILSKCIDNT